MPVILDDVQQNVVLSKSKKTVKSYKAKFFSDILTGSGKKTGLLSEYANPASLAASKNGTITSANINTQKQRVVSGDTVTTYVPLNPLTSDAWSLMTNHKRPDLVDMTLIAERPTDGVKVYIDMPVHSIIAQETEGKTGGKIRKSDICYHLFLYTVVDPAVDTHKAVNVTARSHTPNTNEYFAEYTVSPVRYLQTIENDLTNCGFITDTQAMTDFINNYSTYEAVCKRSEEWQAQIDTILGEFIDNITVNNGNNYNDRYLRAIIKRLEMYSVPLDLYRNIYQKLQNSYKPDEVAQFCKHNLNLLLSDTLNSLETNKPNLQQLPTPTTPVQLPSNVARWSSEQKLAVTTTEPLVLVQAGAGTGKSTVIMGRLGYMQSCGVDASDITILSFTNAAADHITDLDPNVNSMTIAKMVHTIYAENFPAHELSSESTLINCIDIYFPGDALAYKFKWLLKAVADNDANAYTDLNNFVEDNYDFVIKVLDTTRQTTLTLEIIICYQKIDVLTEPAEITSKYLIVDEVQDNSIFEFIYTLKYVDKHKESLFIVGDCSQTLYEFRGSNPRGLNVLEGSGVFATYQLQTNYRSNQEILDFANKHLLDIEANQQANLQLRANSLAKVTEKTFRRKVNLSYHQLQKIGDFSVHIGPNFAVYCKNYIDDCLARGEQVAILAYKRKDILQIQESLKNMYPNATINNLIPERQYDKAIFSQFIKNYWNEVQFIPTKSIEFVIVQAIIGKTEYLMRGDRNKNLPKVQSMASGWRTQYGQTVQTWQTQYVNGILTKDQFFENIKETLLDYEIRQNSIRQSLLAAKNEEAKRNADPNANFVLSTIHSAKGLEFENCIVIHRNANNMDEDQKRMYYVAFTRARNTEFILSYDTVKNPQIEANYALICKQLHAQDLAIAQACNKVTNVISNGQSILTIEADFYNPDGTYAIANIPRVSVNADDDDDNAAIDDSTSDASKDVQSTVSNFIDRPDPIIVDDDDED